MLNELARVRRLVAEPVVEVTGTAPTDRTVFTRPLGRPDALGSLADIAFTNAAEAPDTVVVRRKTDGTWRDVTARQLADDVSALAGGLIAQGLEPGGRVALMARTTYEWMLVDLATWAAGGVVVPIYPTSSAEQARWILTDSGAMFCVVETREQVDMLGTTGVSVPVACIDEGAVEDVRRGGADVEPSVVEQRRAAISPQAVATVIYTSGTTGRPKGCVLTHASLLAEVDSITALLLPPFRAATGQEPSTILFLPLAHVLGRVVQLACLRERVVLGHAPSVAPDELRPDLASFEPTFLVGIPYVFEKIRDVARQQATEMGKAGAFGRAERVAERYGRLALEVDPRSSISPWGLLGLRLAHRLYDLLVYRRIRAALGGRVRYAISGGSALSPRLTHFFAGAGVVIVQGYGLTETCAAITINPPTRPRPDTVGRPVPGAEVRVAGNGEVQVRGPQVFSGYHESGEGIDDDGWFSTGDLGVLDADGYLTVTGRSKEILVTSTGKNVSPGPMEDQLRGHPLISQCMFVGDDRPFVAALITLDTEAVEHWRAHTDDPSDDGLRRTLQDAVDEVNATVSRAESIRAFAIVDDDFTEDNGLLTPSLKLRRAHVLEACAAEIDALYASARSTPR